MGIAPRKRLTLNQTAGRSLARLIRFVVRTSSIVTEPASLKSDLRKAHPIILATWHGQFMMTCYLKPEDVKVAAMVARHGDAELIGEAMAAFGVELIRGAGAGIRKKDRGGAHALRAAVTALTGAEPASLVMTADVPPGPARRAGEGIITIARLSGCPIVPVAAASSRYKAFKTWSRVTVNLPFSKLAFVGAAPIHVPRDADPETLERLRQEVETSLNAVTARAYELAGSDPARATPPNPASLPVKPGLLLATYCGFANTIQPLTRHLLQYRRRRGKEDEARISERQGVASQTRPSGPLVWVHAASVGETNAVIPLIDALVVARPDLNVVLTTTTVTSAAVAAARLPARAVHQFVPLDTPRYAASFLDHWRPDLAVFTESEIWPCLILETGKRAIPLALVNARMSARSYKRWKQLTAISEPLFSRFQLIFAQNERLARWFRDVGSRQVLAVGNLKADAPPPPVDAVKLDRLRTRLAGRRCLLAASTHDGEEAVIAAAHRELAAAIPGVCTIIAPRHPDRGPAIADELTSLGFTVALRSRDEPLTSATGIYIADTIGELGTLYACCPVAFIGGSLIERGGQNPIEAASLGSAIITGPSQHNFRDEYDALFKAGGAMEAGSAADLAKAATLLFTDPTELARLNANASTAIAGLKGALARTLAALLPLLPPPETSVHAPQSSLSLQRAS